MFTIVNIFNTNNLLMKLKNVICFFQKNLFWKPIIYAIYVGYIEKYKEVSKRKRNK